MEKHLTDFYGFTPLSVTNPTWASPDYYHPYQVFGQGLSVPSNFSGYQLAHSGEGYCGIIPFCSDSITCSEYREYIEFQIKSPLMPNNKYHFEMYVSLANYSLLAIRDIGVYFSDRLITEEGFRGLPFNPQLSNTTGFITDTLNWVLISTDFIAKGGESFLIIGNFKKDSSTQFLVVNSKTKEVLNYSYYCIDDVTITRNRFGSHANNEPISIYPDPFSNVLYIDYPHMEPSQIILYDVLGRKIYEQILTNSTILNTEAFAAGTYIYIVSNNQGIIQKGRLIKTQ